jgi:hypothetical protein
MEASALPDAVRVNAIIRSGVPIQVSVGAEAGENGSWDLVEGKIKLNGREYDGDGDMPLYVLRGGMIYESSIVTFGADDQTGRLAAKQNQLPVSEKSTMSISLKATLGKFAEKHHGLVARCVAETDDKTDEKSLLLDISTKIHAAELVEKDALIKALQDENADMKAKLAKVDQQGIKADDYGVGGPEKKEEKESAEKVNQVKGSSTRGIKFGASEGGENGKDDGSKPATLSEAMHQMTLKGSKLSGFALRKAARAQFPDAKEG